MRKEKASGYDKKNIFILLVLTCLWIGYFVFFNNFHNDFVDLITKNAKIEIQLLELFYYRGQKTIIFLVTYFALVCSHVLFIQYIRVRSNIKLKDNKFNLINIAILTIGILISLFNVLGIINIVLAIFGITINHIIYIVSRTKYDYYDGEVLYEKDNIQTEEEAKKILAKKLIEKQNIFNNKKFELIGDIIQNEDTTYKVELTIEEIN